MSNLLRRLRKLELQLTDRNGLVPHTKPWQDYWNSKIDKLIAGEVIDQKIPLEAFRALIHAADVDGYHDQAGRYDEADQQTS